MTPQEHELVSALFDRLTQLESTPRDPDAERVIAEGLSRAPHAIYGLVQTVLVQDEALKAANTHIQELEAKLGDQGGDQQPSSGGFLDNMRNSLLGRRDAPRGSVPSVRPGAAPGFRSDPGYAPAPSAFAGPAPAAYGGYGGGSFLGTAAASAAGMIGGSLLLNGIRGMLGGHQSGVFAPAFDHLSSGRVSDQGSPWGGGSGDLAKQAGLDDIGGGRTGSSDNSQGQGAGLMDTATNDTDTGNDGGDDDYGSDDDGGGDDFGGGGDDTDSA